MNSIGVLRKFPMEKCQHIFFCGVTRTRKAKLVKIIFCLHILHSKNAQKIVKIINYVRSGSTVRQNTFQNKNISVDWVRYPNEKTRKTIHSHLR